MSNKDYRVTELEGQLAQAEADSERFCQRIGALEAERAKVVTIIMGNTQCGNLPPYIEGIVRDLNESQAIVEKLPRMEDGALWCETDDFWYFDSGVLVRNCTRDFTLKELAAFIAGEYGPCYSTHSAAEAAAKEGAGT